MEVIRYEFPASVPVRQRAHVGVVASGDLEILIEPSTQALTSVVVTTSVDGYGAVWSSVVERFARRHPACASIEINDFGATPGMVMLRLEQALEASL